MKTRKILAVILASVLAISMLAGCGGNNGGNANVELNKEVLNLEGYLASAEPMELTIHYHTNGGLWMWQNDGPITKKAAEMTNINVRNTASKAQADSAQAYNLMLVEDTLPDIIAYSKTDLDKAGIDGALIPLEDYLEEYAPNIHKVFQEHPEYMNESKASDGHLYYIPNIVPEGPGELWIVRQDWLDKLGLQAPTNVEEFYNVLKAFRDGDPNGNGIKDEIPYLEKTKRINELLPLFGVSYKNWEIDENGKIYNPRFTEEFRYAISEIAKWYKEGLIDPEIYTRSNCREELFGNNLGGITFEWPASTLAFNETAKDTNPGINLQYILPPADINGVVQSFSANNPVSSTGWGISKDNKHVAETLKFFDFFYTEAGINLMAYGIEGEHHIVNADGSIEYTDTVKNFPSGVPDYMASVIGGYLTNAGTIRPEAANMASMAPIAREGYLFYKENVKLVPPWPTLALTNEENQILVAKDIETHINETVQNWVMGNTELNDETWNAYLKRLKDLGAEDVQKVYQAAYDRQFK